MLTVHLGPDALRGTQVVVRLTGSILDRTPISRISPQSQSMSPIPNRQQFTFSIAQPSDSATIRLVEAGHWHEDRLKALHLHDADVMASARLHGL